MEQFYITAIGKIKTKNDQMYIQINESYILGLQQLQDFSHVNVLWWFSELDDEHFRNQLTVKQPYKNSPSIMGTFATRSPLRPNPIALTTVQILELDYEQGTIKIPYIDAHEGTPVIDLKPYTPSLDRVNQPTTPSWCSHWPNSIEESSNFDWSREFNF